MKMLFCRKITISTCNGLAKMPHTLGKTLKIWSVLAKLRV